MTRVGSRLLIVPEMTDTFSKKKRSEIMRAVKSKGNKSTEGKIARIFRANKISGWRRNSEVLGHPDFVFPEKRVAVFADGCFWHGHGCRNITPSDNAEYWKRKIQRNIERDATITRTLRKQGWKVVRVWECEVEKKKYTKKLNRIRDYLNTG